MYPNPLGTMNDCSFWAQISIRYARDHFVSHPIFGYKETFNSWDVWNEFLTAASIMSIMLFFMQRSVVSRARISCVLRLGKFREKRKKNTINILTNREIWSKKLCNSNNIITYLIFKPLTAPSWIRICYFLITRKFILMG